jgi:aspartyl-tRNA(Asn)/glutamyl-tRNA(Gln) amidotransferase subunit C
MATKISADEVRETALLARLELAPAEIERLTGELDAILGYMETLAALDVTDVEPTTHALPLDLRLAADEAGPQLDVEAALADAPARDGEFFQVPKIIDVSE